MHKIGIISGAYDVDQTSQELLERAGEVADAAVVDPLGFRAEEGRLLAEDLVLDEFDALIVRLLNPEGDSEFQYDFLLRLADAGVYMINTPRALAVAESKFMSAHIMAEAGLPVPETIVSQHTAEIMGFVHGFGDVVAKPLYGFQGQDVIRVSSSEDDAVERIGRLVGEYKVVMAQPYIENPGRDIRAFVVGDEVVASIYRFAPRGEWKTNVHAGGKVAEHRLSEDGRALCVRVAKSTGLDYTGVDLIEGPDGFVVLEINGAPAWAGLEFATGVDIAKSIVDLTVRKLDKKTSENV